MGPHGPEPSPKEHHDGVYVRVGATYHLTDRGVNWSGEWTPHWFFATRLRGRTYGKGLGRGGRLGTAEQLEEGDRPGGRGVEGRDGAAHWKRDGEIAAPGHIRPNAAAFTADDQRDRSRQVDSEEILLLRASGKTNDPPAFLLQAIEGTGEVRNACDQQMLDGPGRGIDCGRRDTSCSVLRQKNPCHAACLGSAEERTNILGVLEVVERENGSPPAEDVVERGIWKRRSLQGNPLVVCPRGEVVQHGPRDALDRNAGGDRRFLKGLEPAVFANTFREEEASCRAPTPQRLTDSISAIQKIAANGQRRGTRLRRSAFPTSAWTRRPAVRATAVLMRMGAVMPGARSSRSVRLQR